MPTPAKCGEFLDSIRNSGVLEDKALDTFLQENPDLPEEPAKIADRLVESGLLTRFQTELLKKKVKVVINGKYKLLDQLGKGGMGTVYLCEHKIMRRRVAIKVLPNNVGKDPSAVERFHREARACAALDHPNICRAHDVDQDGKMHFLVIEYIEGASLQATLAHEGPMDVKRAADCIRQTALGLQHAHEAGLVHRDIKPANLLLDKKGNVKILDMGLALFFQDNDDNLTQQFDKSSVLGTADYLAPEQGIDSHGVDIRADIYALGLTFFFLLTRQSAYGEGTVTQKLLWHQMKQPKPVRELAPNVPAEVEAIIMKMVAKNPAERYQTPQEVAEVLKPWAEGTGPVAKPATRPETLSSLQDETGKIPPKANGVKKKAASDTPPPGAKTGRTRVDAPGNTALRGKTKVDRDKDDDAKDSGRRLGKKAKKKNFTPLIVIASAAAVFLLVGVGLMIWAMTRSSNKGQAKVQPGTSPTSTPNPPVKTADPNPKPPVPDPKAKPPDPTPKPPDPVKPPPPPPPPAQTVTAEYFPYKPGLTLNYVEVSYINDGMGVARHQKNEFKDGGVIETTSTKAGMVQGGKYLAGKPVEWNVSPVFIKKFNIRLGKAPQTLHFRLVEGQNAEIGKNLLNTKDVFWDPVLKLGAKQGDTWEYKFPNGTTKKYTLERFEKKDGLDAVVVKSQMPVQQDTELVTYSTFAKRVGEVERISNLHQKDKVQTVTEMKLVPE